MATVTTDKRNKTIILHVTVTSVQYNIQVCMYVDAKEHRMFIVFIGKYFNVQKKNLFPPLPHQG